jgi:hypothetical protein
MRGSQPFVLPAHATPLGEIDQVGDWFSGEELQAAYHVWRRNVGLTDNAIEQKTIEREVGQDDHL